MTGLYLQDELWRETRREQAVRVLRNERAVVLVESLGPKASR